MVYIKRTQINDFEKLAKIYNILAVVGPRQAGKTTFLKEKLNKNDANYIFFDDFDAKQMFEEDIKKFESQYLTKNVSILDEIQYCENSGPKLKYLADSNYKLWITSSSEVILSKEVLSYLVGRVTILKLYPFSLQEFLESKNQKEYTNIILKRIIHEHALFGGYPKVCITEDFELKKQILKDLNQTMILKDVAKNFNIEDINALEKFVNYISLSYTNMMSYADISSDLNMSFQTIKKYLDALEKSYLIKLVKPFFNNKLKEISKQPKLYFYDTGLRNSISNDYAKNLSGELFENYVFSELVKKGFEPKYWRTKTKLEIDFILDKEQKVPIEVKLKPPKSLPSSIKSFIDEYNPKKAFIVNYGGVNKKIKYKNCDILICDVVNLLNNL